MLSLDRNGEPQQVTSSAIDTTFDLRWAGNEMLVFDRIPDESFYSHARIWKVTLPQ